MKQNDSFLKRYSYSGYLNQNVRGFLEGELSMLE